MHFAVTLAELDRKKPLVIPTSLYRSSLNRGTTVYMYL